MNQALIFCESYDELETLLYLITRDYQKVSLTVAVPGNRDLFQYLEKIKQTSFDNGFKNIYLDTFFDSSRKVSHPGKITRIMRILPHMFKERRYLDDVYRRHLASLRGVTVFFLARYMNPETFYFIRRLAPKNNLVYTSYTSKENEVVKDKPAGISALAMMLRSKFVYGRGITHGRLPYTRGFTYISDEFMKRWVSQTIEGATREQMLKGFRLDRFKVFDAAKYSVIYFDQPLLKETGYIDDYETYRKELTRIFGVLTRYYPASRIALKYHPHYPSDRTLIPAGEVLPDFIPGELLYNDNIELYLGIITNCLSNVEKGLSVSLANLITFRSTATRERLKEMMIDASRSKILFPGSLDDFEAILARTAGRTKVTVEQSNVNG